MRPAPNSSDTTLGICIPTFNRCSLLQVCLESLLPEVRQFGVPIYISDNGSTDATEQVVQRLAQQYPLIFYRRHDQNKGFDYNVKSAALMASTEYIWFMSDDDVVIPGALNRIYSEVLTGNWSVVVVNREERDVTLEKVLVPRTVPFYDAKVYTDCRSALVDLGWYMTFLPGLIMRKASWTQPGVERYVGTDFVHVGVLFQGLSDGGDLLFLDSPAVLCRLGNYSYETRQFEVWMKHWPEVIQLLPDTYSKADRVRAVRRLSDVDWLARVRGYRIKGLFNLHSYLSMWRHYYPLLTYLGFSTFLLCLLPIGMLKFVKSLVNQFREFVGTQGVDPKSPS